MVPNIIFIIPYRDRIQHRYFFDKYMKHILEDEDNYEIYYAEQKDTMPFNRGAMKNIGFIAMKEKYKNDYKNITFVFNDIDCVPYKKNLLDYNTTKGNIKHFYGHKNILGGIISIKGEDFEKMNGYPNYWTWGYEDNILGVRAKKKNIHIDYSVFYKINHPNILHFYHGSKRTHDISLKIVDNDNGLSTINTYKYTIDKENINITKFTLTKYHYVPTKYIKEIDITTTEYTKDKAYVKKIKPHFKLNLT